MQVTREGSPEREAAACGEEFAYLGSMLPGQSGGSLRTVRTAYHVQDGLEGAHVANMYSMPPHPDSGYGPQPLYPMDPPASSHPNMALLHPTAPRDMYPRGRMETVWQTPTHWAPPPSRGGGVHTAIAQGSLHGSWPGPPCGGALAPQCTCHTYTGAVCPWRRAVHSSRRSTSLGRLRSAWARSTGPGPPV